MFDHDDPLIGLLAEETEDASAWCDDDDSLVARLLVIDDLATELATRPVAEHRHVLPDDLESIPPGPFLAAILGSVNSSLLNGFDLVRHMKAEERLVAHHQAGSLADASEVAYAAPGDAMSDQACMEEAFEFASDEIRAALVLTEGRRRTVSVWPPMSLRDCPVPGTCSMPVSSISPGSG